jgi:hypothetical protein
LVNVDIVQVKILASMRISALLLTLLLVGSLPAQESETEQPAPSWGAEGIGDIRAYRQIQYNLMGRPYGVGRLIPIPQGKKANYYRFYYSPGQRLLAIKRIRKGESAADWTVQLRYHRGRLFKVQSSEGVRFFKWNKKGNKIKATWYKKKGQTDPDSEEEETEEQEDSESVTQPQDNEETRLKRDKRLKTIPWNTLYYYKGRKLARIDRLAMRKADKALLKKLASLKGKPAEEEEDEEEPEEPAEESSTDSDAAESGSSEEEEDYAEDEQQVKIPIVKRYSFRGNFLSKVTVFTKGLILRQREYQYDSKGQVENILISTYHGKQKTRLYQKERRPWRKKATILRPVMLRKTFGRLPGAFNLFPPYMQQSSSRSFRLRQGSQVQITEVRIRVNELNERTPWYKVRTKGGSQGWIPAWYASSFGQKLNLPGVALHDASRMYSRPGFNNKVIKLLSKNQKIHLYSRTHGRTGELLTYDSGDKLFESQFFKSQSEEEEEQEEEEQEDETAKKTKSIKPLPVYLQGYPWYYVKSGRSRGWVYGEHIGENFRRYGNHYFLMQTRDQTGQLYQFNAETGEYEPIPSGRWQINPRGHYSRHIQRTNWDLRDVDRDGQMELLLRRYLDKSDPEGTVISNHLIVYNLSQKKAHPQSEIPLSKLKFLPGGPLDDYIENIEPPKSEEEEQPEEEEEGPAEEEEEQAEEVNEEEASEEDSDEESEEDSDSEALTPEEKWNQIAEAELEMDAGLLQDEEFGEPWEPEEEDEAEEGKPKAPKRNYNFKKRRVWFVSRLLNNPPYILQKTENMVARESWLGRPLDGRDVHRLNHFSPKMVKPDKLNYRKFYLKGQKMRKPDDTSDYSVHPSLP